MKRLRILSVHEMLSLDANSRLADSSSATPVLKIACPSLVRLDADMRLQPALAADWIVSDDQRIFTFRLQEGATFHSGRAVTAEAVAWNFERLFDSRVGSLLAVDYTGVESIRATAEDTVEFRYAEPFPAFLHQLAGRTHVAEDCQTQPSRDRALSSDRLGARQSFGPAPLRRVFRGRPAVRRRDRRPLGARQWRASCHHRERRSGYRRGRSGQGRRRPAPTGPARQRINGFDTEAQLCLQLRPNALR